MEQAGFKAFERSPIELRVNDRSRVDVSLEVGQLTDRVTVVDIRPGRDARTLVEVVVHEGRKHVVRNMLAAVDLPVVRLVRTQFGPLRLDRLAPGSYRKLSQAEVAALYEAVGL